MSTDFESTFPGYFRPRPEVLADLVARGQFFYDANVLLNLYRYSADTRDEFAAVLRALSERNSITYAAGLEFHRNRVPVILDQVQAAEKVRASLKRERTSIMELHRAPSKPTTEVQAKLDAAWDILDTYLNENVAHAIKPSLSIDDDQVWQLVSELFAGRTGSPPDDETATAWSKEGRRRFASKIPPGFLDDAKPEPDKFGDWFGWREMLDYATRESQPIIFVTDEDKEDWWLRVRGQTLGPRPELVAEMKSVAGQDFYMYRPATFLEVVGPAVRVGPGDDAIAEVRDLKPRDVAVARIPGFASFSDLQRLEGRRVRLNEILNEIDQELAVTGSDERAGILNGRRQRVVDELIRTDQQLQSMLPTWGRTAVSSNASVPSIVSPGALQSGFSYTYPAATVPLHGSYMVSDSVVGWFEDETLTWRDPSESTETGQQPSIPAAQVSNSTRRGRRSKRT